MSTIILVSDLQKGRKKMRAPLLSTLIAALLATCIATGPLLTLGGCTTSSSKTQEGVSTQTESASTRATSSSESSSESHRDARFEDIPESALINTTDLKAMIDSGNEPFVLDIRSNGSYQSGSIHGSRNIPAGRQIDLRMNEIPTDEPIVIIAMENERLAEVRQTLIDNGYQADNILIVRDGMDAWIEQGYPTIERLVTGC